VSRYIDKLIERKKKNEKYFANYMAYASKIKEAVQGKLKDPRVLVFGSVVKGTWIPNKSDIDILIISQDVSKSATWQSNLKIEILKEIEADLSAPFEFHFVTPETYSYWYEKSIHDEYKEA
jgi:predicted nucleotidyltransferase